MDGATEAPKKNGIERAIDKLEPMLDEMSARQFLDRVYRYLNDEGDSPFHVTNLHFEEYTKVISGDFLIGDRIFHVSVDLDNISNEYALKNFVREFIKSCL